MLDTVDSSSRLGQELHSLASDLSQQMVQLEEFLAKPCDDVRMMDQQTGRNQTQQRVSMGVGAVTGAVVGRWCSAQSDCSQNLALLGGVVAGAGAGYGYRWYYSQEPAAAPCEDATEMVTQALDLQHTVDGLYHQYLCLEKRQKSEPQHKLPEHVGRKPFPDTLAQAAAHAAMAQDLAEYDPITGEPLVSEQCPNDEDKPDAVADEYMSTRNFTRAAEEDVLDHALPAVFMTGRTLEQRFSGGLGSK